MMRLTGLALVLVAVACSTSRRVPPRGDAGPPPMDGGGVVDAPRPDVGPLPDAPRVCLDGTTPVDVTLDARIEEACAIWNSLDALAGMATITRTGDTLTIDFGDGVVFTGTATGDSVVLAYVHPHEFTDGCGWQATETLVGSINSDCSLSLTYDYVEAVAIDRGLCATPCAAGADVMLELMPLI